MSRVLFQIENIEIHRRLAQRSDVFHFRLSNSHIYSTETRIENIHGRVC